MGCQHQPSGGRRRARRAARLDGHPGARPVRPAGRPRRRRRRRLPGRAQPGRRWSSASASIRRSSAPGCCCTSSPTAPSSPACRGCAATSPTWSTTSVRLANPDPHRLADAVREAFSDRDRAMPAGARRRRVRIDRLARAARADPADRRADVAAGGPRRRHDEPRRRRPGASAPSASPRCCRLGASVQPAQPAGAAPHRHRGQAQPVRGRRALHRRDRGRRRAARRRRLLDSRRSNLPSLEEIRNPQHWLDRMGALVG